VYSELERHIQALRHAEDAVRISESQAAINASYAQVFAEYVGMLGAVHLKAGRVPAACASFRRSQALLVDLSAKGIPDSSDLAARIRNNHAALAAGLAACGPRAERVADPRRP
jgi:hypothetical protein